MNTTELLVTLNSLGIRMAIRGDCLRCYPRSLVTSELVNRIKGHKQELLSILRANAADIGHCDDCGVELVETPTHDRFLNFDCPRCGRCYGCRPSDPQVIERLASRPIASRRRVLLNSPPKAKQPPSEIVADPTTWCHQCGEKMVLRATPGSEEGLCFDCWNWDRSVN